MSVLAKDIIKSDTLLRPINPSFQAGGYCSVDTISAQERQSRGRPAMARTSYQTISRCTLQLAKCVPPAPEDNQAAWPYCLSTTYLVPRLTVANTRLISLAFTAFRTASFAFPSLSFR